MERVRIDTNGKIDKSKTPVYEKGRRGRAKGSPKTGGRQLGQQNHLTYMIKDCILQAATLAGSDGRGKDGAVGYLTKIANKKPELFCRLLERLLPYQVTGKDGGPVQMQYGTLEEIRDRLKERGIPAVTLLAKPTHVAPVTEQ
jgi:hypothetical protein